MSLTSCTVIVTMDRQEEIRRLLGSMKTQERLPDKIVFVDSSDTGSLDKLAHEVLGSACPKVVLIMQKCTLPEGRNRGALNCGCDIVSFIDDDAVLEPRYFAEIVAFFEKDVKREVAGVEGEITNPPFEGTMGQLLRNSINLLLFLSCPGKGYIRRSGWPRPLFHAAAPTRVEFVSGSNMTFRREILEEFKFDEELLKARPLEDMEYSQRVSRNRALYHLPGARMQHMESRKARAPSVAHAEAMVLNPKRAHKRNMPQTFRNKLALRLSFVGLFLHLMLGRRVDDMGPFLRAVMSE